ncbi:hypothetical protein L6164_021259 [Bauhinia variegata]|uniref:Uncharacterized protein n=1 Tax=Bauhinia variegata TaxID=167791 RepID=A0ACB9MXZ8_BAUVA|nr:hypothetical protein L6164_021259 [Bauhinia variegata]
MRPVFVGNFEYDTHQSELERLFGKYGRIERVNMKSGTSTKGNYAELLSWLANLSAKISFGRKPSCLSALIHPP